MSPGELPFGLPNMGLTDRAAKLVWIHVTPASDSFWAIVKTKTCAPYLDFFSFLAVLGMEPRASHMQGKYFTVESHPCPHISTLKLLEKEHCSSTSGMCF